MLKKYKEIIEKYDETKNDHEKMMGGLIALILSNDYDELDDENSDNVVTTILDFCVEYPDYITTPEQKEKLATAVAAIVEAIRNSRRYNDDN